MFLLLAVYVVILLSAIVISCMRAAGDADGRVLTDSRTHEKVNGKTATHK